MQNGSHDNGMTEVALALAMGFFSILVLTMVSMGAGDATQDASAPAVLSLAPSERGTSSEQALQEDETIVVYHEGRFFDAELVPIDPRTIHAQGRVILALAPDLAMSDVMAAHAQIPTPNLVVTTFDDRWVEALKQSSPPAGARP